MQRAGGSPLVTELQDEDVRTEGADDAEYDRVQEETPLADGHGWLLWLSAAARR